MLVWRVTTGNKTCHESSLDLEQYSYPKAHKLDRESGTQAINTIITKDRLICLNEAASQKTKRLLSSIPDNNLYVAEKHQGHKCVHKGSKLASHKFPADILHGPSSVMCFRVRCPCVLIG